MLEMLSKKKKKPTKTLITFNKKLMKIIDTNITNFNYTVNIASDDDKESIGVVAEIQKYLLKTLCICI